MWLDSLKELKKSSGMSTKQIADATKIPESTVKRIFAGDTDDPRLSTIRCIVIALGGSLDHILADTNAVISTDSIVDVKEAAGVVEAERDLMAAENAILKDKVAALTAENDMLKMQLKHKEEIIAIHNYYNKLKTSD
jgi:predicted transcriptional regulator